MKVAVIGLAASRDKAPWDDPEWELWGMGWDPEAVGMNRVFEVHDDWEEIHPKEYRDKLNDYPVLYMLGNPVAHATPYPIEEVSRTCGGYLESSIAYMTALAIHEGAQEIGLWGVHMKAGEEYGYQKPNMEYLIGLARGKGIKVHIPDESPLCKPSGMFGYLGRYGRRA